MGKKGFTVIELLVAMIVSMIVVGALTSLFIVGNRTFQSNERVAYITEEVRNAITTLDFLFSRWGVGVPCPQNGCNIQTPPPDCTSYPPSDPMCITINGTEIIFYANLYGIGFVQSVDNDNANIISCRLSSSSTQNCYYVWNAGNLKGGYDNGIPKYFSFSSTLTFSGSPDCVSSYNTNLTVSKSLSNNLTLDQGDYITRVPHRIRIYLSNGNIYIDRDDMASDCNDNEKSVILAKVSSFSAQKVGRSVKVDITFIDDKGKTFSITRYYGR
ncbi:MAG: prepilin-type N-terminal cleavage/methylation domain-containing protein [Candidatus Anstonellales archaeon]